VQKVLAPLRHAAAKAFKVHAGSSMLKVPVGHARAIACDVHARQKHVGILSIICCWLFVELGVLTTSSVIFLWVLLNVGRLQRLKQKTH
jgi:hypothetical protein